MPSLNWVGKDKIVNHDKEVPFRLLKKNPKLSVGKSENLIVEGDNLEALKALMPFYYNKVKCIYIDPPYNTGNEAWVYNDKLNSPKIKDWFGKIVGAEGEDLTRHDKWLCMMYPRLKLLRDLMRDDGAIFVSIDDNEHCNLRMAMDEIFGPENFVATVIWQKKYSPQNDAKYFSAMHDFLVVYAKKKNIGSSTDGWMRNLLKRNEEQNARYKNPDNDPRGPWKPADFSVKTYSKSYDYPIKTPGGRVVNPPNGRSWATSIENYKKWAMDKRIYFGRGGNNVPSVKIFLSEVQGGVVPSTLWLRTEVGDNELAKKQIKEIFGEIQLPFETPKPTPLIKRILELTTDKNSLVLDSFAGSGTTGHAVLELNKEDKGDRKFILVELEKKIAKEITAERIKRVIKGYGDTKGLGGGFEYVELSDPLFEKAGNINPDVSYEQMASYVFFTETHTNLDSKSIKGNHLGNFGDSNYFLLFDGIGKNVLDKSFMKSLGKFPGAKVVYADKCLIDSDMLEKNGIVFKQIPYSVKVY